MLAALSSPPGRWVSGGALLLCVLVSSCDESLPTRIVPQNDLEIARVLIAQQTGPAGIQVLSAFYVENMYDETFSGMVNAKGNVRIWWKRRPGFEANLPVRENTQLRLDPGERHAFEVRWLLRADDGRYLLDHLDFSGNDVRYGVRYARPEDFLLEISVTVFEETGLLTSGPHEFTLQGWELEGPPIPD